LIYSTAVINLGGVEYYDRNFTKALELDDNKGILNARNNTYILKNLELSTKLKLRYHITKSYYKKEKDRLKS